jgi:MarR family transcriptional regulator, transcriptional regulator for hemolysin
MRPSQVPIGLLLARTAKTAGRAFDDALAEAGGSRPIWLILLSLIQASHRTQRELAEAVGLTGPTLTHHLTTMERQGLVTRVRADDNRRVQRVSLTDAGRDYFLRLRDRAMAHDARLRAGLSEAEVEQLRHLLLRITANLDE